MRVSSTQNATSLQAVSQPHEFSGDGALPPDMTPPGAIEDPAAGLDRSAPAADYPALGQPPNAMPESALPLDRSSPQALLASLQRARELGDAAACARVSLDQTRFPELNRLDRAWARRSFLSPSGGLIWDRVANALLAEKGECFVQGGHAQLQITFGGALGQWSCWFERTEAGWRLLTDRAPASAHDGDGGAE